MNPTVCDEVVCVPYNERVYVYNYSNGAGVVMHNDVFQMFSNAEKVEDVFTTALEYDDEDRLFLEGMVKMVIEKKLFQVSTDDSSENKLKSINFVITDYCNLSCSHCAHSALLYTKELSLNSPILADQNICKEIIKLSPASINVTGGEPLLVNNFKEISLFLANNFTGGLTLSTNATLITSDNIDYLCDCYSQFDISIDGVNEEKCSLIRGKGVFKKVISAISLLKEKGAKTITLSIALSNDTVHDKEAFEELCKSLDVKPLIRFMNLSGRAKKNELVGSDDWLNFGHNYSIRPHLCNGGVNQISVNSNGDVFPCNNFLSEEFKIGNLLSDDFSKDLKRDIKHSWFKAFSQYIPFYRNECQACSIKMFCSICPVVVKTYIDSQSTEATLAHCEMKRNKFYEDIFND